MIVSKDEINDILSILTGKLNPSIVDMSPKVHSFYEGWILPFIKFQHAPYIMGLMTVNKDFDDPEMDSKFGASIDKWTVKDLLTHNGGIYPTHVWPGVPIRYKGEKVHGSKGEVSACGHCVQWRTERENPLVFSHFELIFNESLTCDYCGNSFEYADSG